MERFDGQVFVDGHSGRFYALCAVCGRRVSGRRLALLRWGNGLAVGESADGPRQRWYARCRSRAVRQLRRAFNRCPTCGKWVCDACFDLSDGYGECLQCMEKYQKR